MHSGAKRARSPTSNDNENERHIPGGARGDPAAGRAPAEVVDLLREGEGAGTAPHDAPFQLLRVRSGLIPSWANEGFLGASLPGLVQSGIEWGLVSNYMVDFPWLLSACPALAKAPRLVLVHGETGAGAAGKLAADIAAAGLAGKVFAHTPRLPDYGTHHSKAFLLRYARGLRVVIFTANALYCDCNNKTQGVFVQDFPPKDTLSPKSSAFERDLAEYLAALALPPVLAGEAQGAVSAHDFSAARAHLVASVPGQAHHGQQLHSFGHMKLRCCLENEPDGFPAHFAGAPVVAQYSSIGNLSSKWLLEQFVESASAGEGGGQRLGPPALPAGLHLVWPTVGEVRNSVEGWFAGCSIPGYPDKVGKDFLQQYYRRWGGETSPAGRQRAMPHIKTFARFHPGTREIAWLCCTSHNLSKAAWGEKQTSKKVPGREQLKILSFELGVLLVPSREKAYRASRWCGFRCTGDDGGGAAAAAPPPGAADARVRFVAWQRGESQNATLREGVLTVPLPLPYALPPAPYAAGDVPWDVRGEGRAPWAGPDALGFAFPGRGALYGMLQQQEGVAMAAAVEKGRDPTP